MQVTSDGTAETEPNAHADTLPSTASPEPDEAAADLPPLDTSCNIDHFADVFPIFLPRRNVFAIL